MKPLLSPSGVLVSLNQLARADCVHFYATPRQSWHSGTLKSLPMVVFTLWKWANTINPTFIFFSESQQPAYHKLLPSVCHQTSKPPPRVRFSLPVFSWQFGCPVSFSEIGAIPELYPSAQLRTWPHSGTWEAGLPGWLCMLFTAQ